mmetsp:Transcript_31002/g.35316  ORF Transcript_31002/g.35316 Transcript_31002/m.35316 type:complete len:322 (-) Transcript_31002:136-1101(-)
MASLPIEVLTDSERLHLLYDSFDEKKNEEIEEEDLNEVKYSDDVTLCTQTQLKKYEWASLMLHDYIETGYRCFLTLKGATKSIFAWHNETINIWTHLLGFGYFLYEFIRLINEDYALIEKSFLLIYLASAMICMFSSTLFHTYCCCKPRTAKIVFKCDLSGISILQSMSTTCGIYAAYRCEPELNYAFLGVNVVFLLALLIIVNIDALLAPEYKNLRLVCFFVKATFNIAVIVLWAIDSATPRETQLFLPTILEVMVIYLIGLFFYLTKMPESLFKTSRWFDYIFASHQLWHVFVFFGTFATYHLLEKWIVYHHDMSNCKG